MGRPRTYHETRVPTAVRLPRSLHRQLRQVADERNISANLLVTRAVEEYLERLVPLEVTLATTDRPDGAHRASVVPRPGASTAPAAPAGEMSS